MTRIKILDLPRDVKISQDEMRKVFAGIDTVPLPEMPFRFRRDLSPPGFGPLLTLPPINLFRLR